MAPCAHPGMKSFFCLYAKNGLGRFALFPLKAKNGLGRFAKSAGYVRFQVSKKEHDGSSSLLLKAPYIHAENNNNNFEVPGTKKLFILCCSIRLRQHRNHHWDLQFD